MMEVTLTNFPTQPCLQSGTKLQWPPSGSTFTVHPPVQTDPRVGSRCLLRARSWRCFGGYGVAFLSGGALVPALVPWRLPLLRGLPRLTCLYIVRPLALVPSMRRPHENWTPGGPSSWPGPQRRRRSRLKIPPVSLRWLSSLTGRSPAGLSLGQGQCLRASPGWQAGCCTWLATSLGTTALFGLDTCSQFLATQRRRFGEDSP